MEVQSVLFLRSLYTIASARKWLKKNGYIYNKKVDISTNYFRFRQKSPVDKKKYRILKIKTGIKIVLMF